MDKAEAYIALLIGVTTLLGVITGMIRHLVKYYLSELKPDGNGGHNLVGRVERIEQRVDRIYEMLLEEKLAK